MYQDKQKENILDLAFSLFAGEPEYKLINKSALERLTSLCGDDLLKKCVHNEEYSKLVASNICKRWSRQQGGKTEKNQLKEYSDFSGLHFIKDDKTILNAIGVKSFDGKTEDGQNFLFCKRVNGWGGHQQNVLNEFKLTLNAITDTSKTYHFHIKTCPENYIRFKEIADIFSQDEHICINITQT